MVDPVLDALALICGPDYARRVDAAPSFYVTLPATTSAVARVLGFADSRGLTAVPRGCGSKIEWGSRVRDIDVLVDTARLGGLWHHDAAAGVVEVGTGTAVSALQAALALRGQRMPIDPPSPGATVGGVLATNESGPLRLRYGPPSEHVVRVDYVDAAGAVGTSDGEQGRPGLGEIDGVITSATVRLVPLPEARRWVGVAVTSPRQAHTLVQAALAMPELVAIEIDLPASASRGTLAALFEGSPDAAAAQAEALAAAWGAEAVVTPIAPPWWGRYPFGPSSVALRLSAPVEDLPSVIYTLSDAAGCPVPVRGSVGLGSVHAVLPGSLPAARLGQVLDGLRHILMARDGRVVVVSAPPALAAHTDMATRRDFF